MLRKLLPNSEFTKNSIILVIGTIIAQLIPIVISLYLRRVYTPEDFGALAVYLSIVGILIIISSFRYEATIVLPKNDNESANILSLTFVLSILFNGLVFFIILFFKNKICNLINFPIKFSNYLYLLPFTTILYSFYQSINFWLIRQKAFNASSINKITRRGVEGIIQSALGFGRYSSGLVLGDFFGNFANVISGFIQMKRNNFKLRYVSKKKMFFVLKKYKEFPLFNLFPTLLSSAATLLPFIFINKLYSTTDVGYLDLSRLVLSIPLALISVTLSQVIFQQITDHNNHHRSIKNDLLKVLYFLIIIAVCELFIILIWGPSLFGFIFGTNYCLSGVYSQILIYSYIMNFIVSSFSSVFISLKKIKLISVWQMCYFIVICSLLLFNDLLLIDFIKIYVTFEIIMYFIYFILIVKVVREYETRIITRPK